MPEETPRSPLSTAVPASPAAGGSRQQQWQARRSAQTPGEAAARRPVHRTPESIRRAPAGDVPASAGGTPATAAPAAQTDAAPAPAAPRPVSTASGSAPRQLRTGAARSVQTGRAVSRAAAPAGAPAARQQVPSAGAAVGRPKPAAPAAASASSAPAAISADQPKPAAPAPVSTARDRPAAAPRSPVPKQPLSASIPAGGPKKADEHKKTDGPQKAGGHGKPAGAKPAKKPLPPVLAALLAVVKAVWLVVGTVIRLALLLPIPLFLLWYTYTVDRNGWFQGDQYEREIAQAMLAGENISNFGEMDERQITKLYAQNLEEAPHSVALGSSRILQLNRALVGDDTFFNAGMIGAEYADVYDSYYLFDRVDKVPDVVIFGIDPWLFSAGPDANLFKRVDMEMWNEYQYFVLGRTDIDVTRPEENMTLWMAMTSPAFFHETMDYYIDNKENGLRPSIQEGDLMTQSTDVKMADGSFLYSIQFRDTTQEQINEMAQAQFSSSLVNCEEFYELDPEHIDQFQNFIRYVRGKGSEVVFYLSPFHPNAYNWILNFPQRYSGFFQVENWIRQYAAEQGIPVYGSYDPTMVGCEESDFFDAWHVRDTGIVKYFPGLPAIEAARAAGTLPDPLAISPRLPTATVDPVL